MQIKNFKKIIILSSFVLVTCISCSPAFAQVIISNIQSSPYQVNIGESFKINATIVNNSPGTIFFNGGCMSPLSATFDKNVAISPAISCFAIFNAVLPPGQNATISGPGSANVYSATSSGVTNANVTFAYQTANKTQETISKMYTFDVSNSAIVPEFPSIVGIVFVVSIISSIVLVSKTSRGIV